MGIKSTESTPPLIIRSHFTHPGHPLHLVHIDGDFECDGCNGPGHGRRYRCSICTGKHLFDLHERCGTCPSSLSCGFHPDHPLALVVSQGKRGPCVLCGDDIDGLHYACSSGPTKGCSFNIHPLCTELPESVHHALHPNHVLTLQPVSSGGSCLACGCPCYDRWRYRCAACGVDAHLECAFGQCPPQTTQKVAMGHPAVPAACWCSVPQPPAQPSQVYYQQGCFYVVPAGVSNPYTAYYNQNNMYQQPLNYQYNMYQQPLNYQYYYQPGQAVNYTYGYNKYNYYQLGGQQQQQQQQQWGGASSTPSSSNGNNGLINRKRIMSILRFIAFKIAISAATGGIF